MQEALVAEVSVNQSAAAPALANQNVEERVTLPSAGDDTAAEIRVEVNGKQREPEVYQDVVRFAGEAAFSFLLVLKVWSKNQKKYFSKISTCG